MIKKILFYVAAFAVSLVFASNVYAAEPVYDIKPSSIPLVSSEPTVFSYADYSDGLMDKKKYVLSGEIFPSYDFDLAFDNDLSTFTKIFGTKNKINIVFDNNVDLRSYFIRAVPSESTDLTVRVWFHAFDENGNSLNKSSTSNLTSLIESYRDLKIDNVKKIEVYTSSTIPINLYELEFFGSQIIYLPLTDFGIDVTDTTARINWKLPVSSYLDHINVNGIDVGKSVSYLFKDLQPDTEYVFDFDAVYKDGTVVKTNYAFKTDKPKDIIPPSEVTDFKGDSDKTFVDLSWSLPTDEDYEKLLLYRDNVLIKTLTTETNYKDEKLNEDTTYKYKIITVDKTGNKSEGKTITVLTKFTQTNLPPEQPLGLTAKPLSKGVKLSWKNPSSGSVKGYKIYMFEKDVASNNILDKFVITAHAASTPTQVNTDLLSSTSYQVSGLENGTSYGFYIVAVNSSGLSSVPSSTVYATPTINSVPPVNIGGGGSGSNGSNNAGFALSDVTNGVSTWFGGIWLILAFAIGIMVSFIIANRIKKLFVA